MVVPTQSSDRRSRDGSDERAASTDDANVAAIGGFRTQQAVNELPLANAEVVIARVEDYVPAAPFDIVISRAFSRVEICWL